MKKLRWLTLLLLTIFLLLTLNGLVGTYQSSQHSLFDRWGLGRLLFNVTRVILEVAIVVAAVARGCRASLLLRVPALGLVLFRLGVLATVAPAYVGTLQRLGLSVHSLAILVDYVAFLLALLMLLADLLARRLDPAASPALPPPPS